MNYLKNRKSSSLEKAFFCLFLIFSTLCFGQESEDNSSLDDFKGTVSVTQNGISLVPSFSLGKPALMFDLKFIKNRMSFEPDMRFGLNGKPWSFVFWFRHQTIKKDRFSLRLGAHPALNFRTVQVIKDGKSQELIQSRRYVAAEVAPTYEVSKKINVEFYYLHGRGFDEGVKQTNFVVLNTVFHHLYLFDDIFVNISPQTYYLRMDDKRGYYAVGFITLAKDDFPFSLSATFNKALDTEIVPEDDFIWNIALNYNFGSAKKRRVKPKL